MNLKKFISGVSALAVAASAFAGVTAFAADPVSVYERGTTTAWSAADVASDEWSAGTITENGLNQTNTNTGYESSKAISGLINANDSVEITGSFSTGAGPGRDSSYDYFTVGGVSIQANAQNASTAILIGEESKDAGISGRNQTFVFDIVFDTATSKVTKLEVNGTDYIGRFTNTTLSALDNIKIGHYRGGREGYASNTTLKTIEIVTTAQAVSTADYTVNYVYDGNTIKSETKTNVVGETPEVTMSAFTAENIKYYCVSNDAEGKTIAADGSTVVNVVLRLAGTFNYTVVSDTGYEITTGSAVEGESVKAGYPKYINNNGTLYTRNAVSSEYRYTFTMNEDNQQETLGYTATEISNVVYLSEGENIEGTTPQTYGNVPIRSSNAKVGSATSEVTITTLQPGIYTVSGVEYINANAGGYLNFAAGDTTFKVGQVAADFENGKAATNWKEFKQENITITEPTALTVIGDTKDVALDFIYVVKTGDYVAPAADLKATVGYVETVSGTGSYAAEQATLFTVTVKNEGDAEGSYNRVSVTDGTDKFTAEVPTITLAASETAEVIYGGVVEGAYTFNAASVSYVE